MSSATMELAKGTQEIWEALVDIDGWPEWFGTMEGLTEVEAPTSLTEGSVITLRYGRAPWILSIPGQPEAASEVLRY